MNELEKENKPETIKENKNERSNAHNYRQD